MGILLVLLALSADVEPTSSAPTVASALEEARTAEAELDYQAAKRLLAGVFTRADVADDELMEAHLLAGQIERILGNDVEARLHYLVVLRRDATVVLPDGTPPKVLSFFELVREEVKGEQQAEAKLTPPPPEAAPPPPTEAGLPVAPVVAGIGGLLAIIGLGTGVTGELLFAQQDAAFDDRVAGRNVALAGWGTAALGAVVGVTGAALYVAGE